MRDAKKAREYNRAWYLRNIEKMRAYNAAHARKPEVQERRAAKYQELRKDPEKVAELRKRSRDHYWANREKILVRHKEQRDADIDGVRNKSLRRQYGLTLDQVEQMYVAQDGKCSICEETLDASKGSGKRFHVDHCHATGKVRALLCRRCNAGLGGFRDNPDWIRRAADYIERFR